MTLPKEFTEYTCSWLGKELYDELAAALEQEPIVSVRLNPEKQTEQPIALQGGTTLEGTDAVAWATGAHYLRERVQFTFDPLFHAGAYYVQEASSMFLEQALKEYVDRPVTLLDLCAAPGGKSTLARSVVPKGSLVVSNDIVPQRTSVLAENMSKWGDPDCIVTRSMPKDFGKLGGVFDVILTDVPCSGEGMFRKDAQAIEEWSQENVRMCRDRQREIVSAVWPALKPGGILIYSTCTFNQYEDEEQVDWIAETLHAEVLPVSTEESWKVTGNRLKDEAKRHLPVYHFLPGQSRGEGFFLAVLRKKEAETDGAESCGASQRAKKKMKKNGNTSNQSVAGAPLRTLKSWLKEPDKYIFDRREERYFAIDRGFFDLYKQMDGAIHIVQAGIPMARIKGKDLIPETTLALSTQLCTETFPQVTLKYADAIAYLRHESLTLDESVENGFVLMCYDGLPLGFVKNVGKHANNLYPAEWRIRSAMR